MTPEQEAQEHVEANKEETREIERGEVEEAITTYYEDQQNER